MKKDTQKRKAHNRGQSMIEFTFTLVVFTFMMYAAARFAFWLGPDLARRSVIYDDLDMGMVMSPDFEVPPTTFEGAVLGE